jgi:hypothetical protein
MFVYKTSLNMAAQLLDGAVVEQRAVIRFLCLEGAK